MRILITGSSGQLGRALLATAPEEAEIIAPVRSELDLADAEAVRRQVVSAAPDILVNAGAYTAVDKAEIESDLAHSVNAAAVGAMASALREVGGRLVQVSTDFVFDGEASRAYLPGDERNPLSVYGASKAAGEDAAGEDATVIRTAWVHGAGGANFVNTMLRLMRTRSEVRVVADQIGAPTWTGTLAEVIWTLALRPASGIWHWTDAGVASWYDFAVAIHEEALALGVLDRAVPIVPIASSEYPTPAKRPRFSLLDSRETRSALDLEATHWRENLRRMLREESRT
ncbi:dTDP-4-dehydrorhamnose reductase [Tsuneonella dongtanensis]|uniref:dTDP-4-dehydrorhamnose reductase n=1 Tax=Tsuneonella dongtanensis TaxID=692370 RepID=A0A1B2ABI8_9SPHN|nr:dTDP-4-dehydrorhamnose reductase [Tsuneonella dongtanensis]ANY19415.1 dTDP-4-dehydrorhamnose reductase [Tsuneonella dongtanensis]